MTIQEFFKNLFYVETPSMSTRFLQGTNIFALPDDMKTDNGLETGYVLYKDGGDDYVFLSRKILPKMEEKEIESLEQLNQVIKECESYDYLAIRFDNAKRLRVGFIVVKRHPILYMIRLSFVKEHGLIDIVNNDPKCFPVQPIFTNHPNRDSDFI